MKTQAVGEMQIYPLTEKRPAETGFPEYEERKSRKNINKRLCLCRIREQNLRPCNAERGADFEDVVCEDNADQEKLSPHRELR